jgi:hypothetical protein
VSEIDTDWLRQEILGSGAEDYTGLYEIIWSLNTHYPNVTREAKLAAAGPIVLDLLRCGEIMLFTTRWATNQFDPVPASRASELAAQLTSWDDPTDDPYVCYATP